ncbi:MAG: hypothetical protein H6510_09305 [Acidobacteria bacterium]|nr:hypothetical protein [Acidobacteriota bacterium]MCB9398001.1 hypothetical protein [Acidobacteriota bacterium]
MKCKSLWMGFVWISGMVWAQIAQPVRHATIQVGETIVLASKTNDPQISWRIQALHQAAPDRILMGANPGQVVMPEPGLYKLAQVSAGTELDYRFIAVQTPNDNFPPDLTLQGTQRRIVQQNTSQIFELEVDDFEDESVRVLWFQDGRFLKETAQLNQTISVPAFPTGNASVLTQIEALAIDASGQPADLPIVFRVFVYQTQKPPLAKINGFEQDHTDYQAMGGSYAINAQLDAGTVNPTYQWSMRYLDQNEPFFQSTQASVPDLPLERAGVIELSLNLIANGVPSPEPQRLWLYVFDPNIFPETTLTDPSPASFSMEVDGVISLGGFIHDRNFFPVTDSSQLYQEPYYYTKWNIKSPSGLNLTLQSIEYDISFSLGSVGTYILTMSGFSNFGTEVQEPDQIFIQVMPQRTGDDFEPNNTREQAALLGSGQYSALKLDSDDREDWYQFQVTQAGETTLLDVDLRSTAGQDVLAEVFNADRKVHAERLASGRVHPFSFVASQPGTYFLRFFIEDDSKKGDLQFGLGLRQVIPRLIFPEVRNDDLYQSNLVLLNPSPEIANVTMEARNRHGLVLGQFQTSIGALSQLEKPAAQLFSNVNEQIAWVRVLSDHALKGLCLTVSTDGKTGYADSASVQPLHELVIPHIAKDTGVWYTQISAVNASDSQIEPHFQSPTGDFYLEGVSEGYQHRRVRLNEWMPGGTLAEWGRVYEMGDAPVWTGVELFGRNDGPDQTASLELTSLRQKNPNHFYVQQDIYFPHIAKDLTAFWTGLAFVNLGGGSSTLVLQGYNDAGELVASAPYTLTAGEKKIGLANELMKTSDPISWIQLKTDGQIMGYELFGSSQDTRRLAGLNAVRGGSKTLDFPVVWSDQGRWTGIAVVNLEASASVLQFSAYNAAGQIIATRDLSFSAHQKQVYLVSDLFPQASGIAWIRLTSATPVAGFELLGDGAGEHMLGFTIE